MKKEDWNKLSEIQQDKLCMKQDFDFKSLWKNLTEDQKFFVITSNEKYKIDWNNLTFLEKDLVSDRQYFDYEKYWYDLTNQQKFNVIRHRKDFDYKKYWNDLSDENRYYVALKINDFDFDNYVLTDQYFSEICKEKKFKPNWEKLTEKNKLDLLLINTNFDPSGHEKELYELIKENIIYKIDLLKKVMLNKSRIPNVTSFDMNSLGNYRILFKMMFRDIKKIYTQPDGFILDMFILYDKNSFLILPTIKSILLINFETFMRSDKLRKILT